MKNKCSICNSDDLDMELAQILMALMRQDYGHASGSVAIAEIKEIIKIKIEKEEKMKTKGWAVIEETIGSDADSKHIVHIELFDKHLAKDRAKDIMERDSASKCEIVPCEIKVDWR